MSQCLYAYNNPNYDDVVGSGWKAAQVSTVSIMNFSGRIFIGLVSDFAKNKYGLPRSYCLVLVAVMFFISQVVTGSINDIGHLWIASALLGLAYGSAFSLFPTVCIEWFGMRKCCLLPSFQVLLWLVTSSLSYLGGTLTRTVLQPMMPY